MCQREVSDGQIPVGMPLFLSYLIEALLAAAAFRPTKKWSRSRFRLISRTSRSSSEAHDDVDDEPEPEPEEAAESEEADDHVLFAVLGVLRSTSKALKSCILEVQVATV